METITSERLKSLLRAERKLSCLESSGVDNWDYYGDALAEYEREIELEDQTEEAFQEILLILSEGAYEPSGKGAGVAFSSNSEQAAYDLFFTLINNSKKGD